MNILSNAFLPIMNFVLSQLPSQLRGKLLEDSRLFTDLLNHGGRKGLLKHAREIGIRGKWISQESDAGNDGRELACALGHLWLQLKMRQREIAPTYLPAPSWGSSLEAEWENPRKWLEAGDFAAFEGFLLNFFRNGGISGLWGEHNMFEIFSRSSDWSDLRRLALFIRQFEAWHREVPGGSLDDLDEARVGNPWGYNIDGRLVVEPAFEYHALSLLIRDLVSHGARPTVLEIGGGFGGLARHILLSIPGVRYIGVDLPENMVLQSWYLKRSLPQHCIRFGETLGANAADLDADAILLPNWALADLQLSNIDIVINVRSFGEMQAATLETYFSDIARLRPQWVYHDNLGASRRGEIYGLSATEFPPLPGYAKVMTCESRWPRYDRHSWYPCREYLYRRIDTERQATPN